MHTLFHLSEPWWHFALRGVVIYLMLLAMLPMILIIMPCRMRLTNAVRKRD